MPWTSGAGWCTSIVHGGILTQIAQQSVACFSDDLVTLGADVEVDPWFSVIRRELGSGQHHKHGVTIRSEIAFHYFCTGLDRAEVAGD